MNCEKCGGKYCSVDLCLPKVRTPLTNAQKQKNHRQRQAGRMARYRSALEEIKYEPGAGSVARAIARQALVPDTQRGDE